MCQGAVRIEREGSLVLSQRFLIVAKLNKAKSERNVRLHEIRIDSQSLLKVVRGRVDVAPLQGFLCSLKFLDRFGGNAQLADRNKIIVPRGRGRRLRSETGAHGIGKVEGVKKRSPLAIQDRRTNRMPPRLGVKTRTKEK